MRYSDARQEQVKFREASHRFRSSTPNHSVLTNVEILELAILLAVEQEEPLAEAQLLAMLLQDLPVDLSLCPNQLKLFMSHLLAKGHLSRGRVGHHAHIYCLNPLSLTRLDDLFYGPVTAGCARLTHWGLVLRLNKMEQNELSESPLDRQKDISLIKRMRDYITLRQDLLEERMAEIQSKESKNNILMLLTITKALQYRMDRLLNQSCFTACGDTYFLSEQSAFM